jgi:threonine/homoserine/homoserine lactone efflux protein
MTLHTWWLFLLMTFFVSAAPGPNMLLVMGTSARQGWRAAVATMAGCMTALIAMMSLSAAGLGALLQAFPAVFDTLRILGAAYLAWLGVQQWRAPVADAPPAKGTTANTANTPLPRPGPQPTPRALYRQGVLVAASNPKAILFAAAFLPQFIQADAPALPQFAILLTTFSVVEVAWYGVYAAGGDRAARYLKRATVQRWFNRLTGGAFIGFAALMADLRR